MTRTRRAGFTLVELMVVMALAVVLAGLAVAVAESGAFGSQKVVSAGDRASGWLLVAKQRAIRDQRPRGVRFLLTQPDPTGNPTLFTAREAQYIEVPDAWVPDRSPSRPVSQRAFLAYTYTTQWPMSYVSDQPADPNYYLAKAKPNPQRLFVVLPAAADQAEFQQRVQAGNLLTLPAAGATYRIDQIWYPPGLAVTVNGVAYTNSAGNFPVYELILGQATTSPIAARFTYPDLGAANSGASAGTQLAPPGPCATEYNFAFTAGFSGGTSGTGGPQPLVGEPLLQLTGNAVIDVRGYPRNPPGSPPVFNTSFSPTVGPGPGPAVEYPMTAGVTVSGSAGNLFFDVLFSPSGQVLGASDGLICLWVRDPDKTTNPRVMSVVSPGPPATFSEARSNAPATPAQGFDYAGEQKLVVVYTRTGLIATHEILPPPADPYTAARDGLNSGL